MAINVISDAPHVPRNILRTTQAVPAVATNPATAENWDFVHWQQFRYEIVDALARFPDALQAFIAVVESFRARVLPTQAEAPTG